MISSSADLAGAKLGVNSTLVAPEGPYLRSGHTPLVSRNFEDGVATPFSQNVEMWQHRGVWFIYIILFFVLHVVYGRPLCFERACLCGRGKHRALIAVGVFLVAVIHGIQVWAQLLLDGGELSCDAIQGFGVSVFVLTREDVRLPSQSYVSFTCWRL